MRTRRRNRQIGTESSRQMTRRQLLSGLAAAGAVGLTEPTDMSQRPRPRQPPPPAVCGHATPRLCLRPGIPAGPEAAAARVRDQDRHEGGPGDPELPGLQPAAEMELSGGGGSNDVMTLVFIQSSKWINAKFATDLTPIIEDAKLTERAGLALEDFSPGALESFSGARRSTVCPISPVAP